MEKSRTDHNSMVHPELFAQGYLRDGELATGPSNVVHEEFANGPRTVVQALARLSALLGVDVVTVRRDRPAHERMQVDIVEGRWVRRPARAVAVGPDEPPVARQHWRVTLRPPEGAVLCLVLTSDQIRNGRHFTNTLRGLGSAVVLDNQTARRCLALMHRVIEIERENTR